MEELLIKIKFLEEENALLKNELEKTKEHLKKYTSPNRNKKYYESHKSELLQKIKSHGPLNPVPRTSFLHKTNCFFFKQLTIKFYEIRDEFLNDFQKHSLKIQVINDDNNYTNGFLTKSTGIWMSFVHFVPKEILVNYKNANTIRA